MKKELKREQKNPRRTWNGRKKCNCARDLGWGCVKPMPDFSVWGFWKLCIRSSDGFEGDKHDPQIHMQNLCVQQPLWLLIHHGKRKVKAQNSWKISCSWLRNIYVLHRIYSCFSGLPLREKAAPIYYFYLFSKKQSKTKKSETILTANISGLEQNVITILWVI